MKKPASASDYKSRWSMLQTILRAELNLIQAHPQPEEDNRMLDNDTIATILDVMRWQNVNEYVEKFNQKKGLLQ